MTEPLSPPPGSPTPPELVAHLRADQRQRWLRGERFLAEDYRDQVPALRANPEALLHLVWSEFLLREHLGETPTLDEYARRFPDFRQELQRQLEVRRGPESPPTEAGQAWPATFPPPGPPRSDSVLPPLSTIDQQFLASTAEIALPPQPLPPYRFGDYELLEKLGRGGMGMVYLARHLHLHRLEALKVISGTRIDSLMAASGGRPHAEALRRRLAVEMRTLARLKHPNIVEVYGAGEEAGELYFSMAYEEGGDLARLVKREGPLAAARAADLVRQVAEAVAYAHGEKVVHRDLKPQNVLLSKAGTPRVTDFGLALLLARGEDGQLAPGALVGTPCYMPPEQAAGRSDERSDVYGLGAILYELLTGQPPLSFPDGAPLDEMLRRVREERPRRPRDLNEKVPRRLEAICLKCLEPEPGRRYPTAGHVAAALRDFLRPPWWRSRWRELVAAACLVPVLLLAGFWAFYLAPRNEARREAERAKSSRLRGDRIEALAHYENARQQYTNLLGGYLPCPDRLSLQLALAETQTWRGVLLEAERQPDKAEAALDETRNLLEGLSAADRARRESRLLLAEVYHNLGIHFGNLVRPRQALDNYQKGLWLRLELREEMGNQPGYRRDLARSYGYMGDTQLELGRVDEARQSYAEAEKLRAQLVADNPGDADALCLHARDFGNLGYLYDWTGDADRAVQKYREQLAVYEPLPADRLPGDYLTERADTRVTIAELELDRPRPAADVARLLDEAEAEYRRCWGDDALERGSPAAKAALARVAVARGKYHFLRKEDAAATQALAAAERLLTQLRDEKAYQPADLYRLALVKALDHQLAGRGGDDFLALDLLQAAVRGGFKHLEQLKRDRGFEQLRQSRPEKFREVVAAVEARRRQD
jgi:tetratricopeptide (TPR) repeat protein